MSIKKSKVKHLRNILQSPLNITWQEKSDVELNPVQNALKELLPNAKIHESAKTSWQKGERKMKPLREKNLYRCHLALGYQSVLRGMEKKELSCVLLSNQVTPVLLLKMALVLAHTNSIPVLIVPDLKSITKTSIGFSSMALGFKKNLSVNNIFSSIIKLVSENPTVIKTPFPINTKPIKNPILTQDTKSTIQDQDEEITTEYLFRAKNGTRAFIPKQSLKNQISRKAKKNKSSDFIAFGEPKSLVQTSTRKSFKNQTENVMIENDESDSDEDNLFFVDSRPDKDLLKKSEENKVKPPTLNKKKSKPKQYLSQSISAHFQPPNMKAVCSNSKRAKKKNKKKKL